MNLDRERELLELERENISERIKYEQYEQYYEEYIYQMRIERLMDIGKAIDGTILTLLNLKK